MLQRAQTLGLLSGEQASACLQELNSGTALRLPQVLLRSRLMKGDIIMALFQQVRDLATPQHSVIGSQTSAQIQTVSDVIPQVRSGDSLAGYVLQREVARGGMGFLFEAKNEAGARVAIKVLSHEAAGSADVVTRFEEEGRLASNLSHPNLIKIHNYGVERGVHYQIMDFFDGKPLSDLIRPGRLTPKKALSTLAKVAEACSYMHANGVVHRDIKPASIMVGRGGRVCLMDLGIAKDTARFDNQLTQMGFGKLLGTPAYMAPEQARGEFESIGPWSDVYAMAAVIYRALTGEYPFACGAYMKTVQAIATQPAPLLSSLRPDAPQELTDLLTKSMSHVPTERPSAAAFGQALTALEETLLMPPGPPAEEV